MTRMDGVILAGILAATTLLVLGPSLGVEHFVGNAGVDVWSHAWGMAWFAESIGEGTIPWTVDGLRHPTGGVLWYIDFLGALVATPANLGGHAAFGYNMVLVLQLWLAALGGWCWERSLGGGGPVAAVALSTTPFLLCTWSNGVLEAGWLGLVALAAALAMRESRWAGPIVGLSFVATPYLGVSAAVIAGVVLWQKRRLKLWVWTMAVGAIVALPMAIGLAAGFDDPASLAIKPPPGPRWPTWRINGVDPRAFVQPGDFWSVRIQGDGAPPFRRTPYLGWTLLVAASIAWTRTRSLRWLVLPLLVGVGLALGPVLYWGGDFVRWPSSGDPVWMPFGWVWSITGVGMDHPLRFVSMSIVVLAGCAGAAVGTRRWLGLSLSAVVALEFLVAAPTVWPLPTSTATLPAVYAALPADGGGVIDLPADKGGTMETSRYLYWHAKHRRPIPYGNKVSGDLLRVENDALRRWTTRQRPMRADARDLQQLWDWGYRWVVLHEALCASACAELQRRVSTELGEPTRAEAAWVWAIPTP